MFGPNFFDECLEGYNPELLQAGLPGFFFPSLDNYSSEMVPKEFFNLLQYSDNQPPDPSSMIQVFDQLFQNLPDEMKTWMQGPYEFNNLIGNPIEIPKLQKNPTEIINTRIFNKEANTLAQERKLKVQKYLEKRKRRNFKKKIIYMCRKKVADKRIRVKGRFVSKIQAESIAEGKGLD
jgi:CCT motif